MLKNTFSTIIYMAICLPLSVYAMDINFKNSQSYVKGCLFAKNSDCTLLDLSNLQIENANLANINFSGSNLNNTAFYNCNLRNANFEKANLEKSIFGYNILYFTSFKDANLRFSKFKKNKMHRIETRGADFSWSLFENTICDEHSFGHCIPYEKDKKNKKNKPPRSLKKNAEKLKEMYGIK